MAHLRAVNGTPEGWVPEYEGQRPPFGPGNMMARTHGATMAEVWGPLAREICAGILDLHEYLRDPRYGDQVMAYAGVEARLRLRRQWLAEQDVESARTELVLFEETEERPSPGVLRRVSKAKKVLAAESVCNDLERLAAGMRKELGLTPVSWAKIRDAMERKQTTDLAMQWSVIDGEAG